MDWHTLSIEQTFKELRSSDKGLTQQEAEKRLQQYGKNELAAARAESVLQILIRQFSGIMNAFLLVGVLISVLVHEYADAIIIYSIVLLNVTIGVAQEFKTSKAIQALKKLDTAQSIIIRNGSVEKISSSDLVPGDLVCIEEGTRIPADIRLSVCSSLKVNESSLTGESVPVDKICAAIPDKSTVLAERFNMLYKGTYACYGRGIGIVTATAMDTELGHIANLLKEKEPETPLQIRISVLTKRLSALIAIICILIFANGILKGIPGLQMLLLALSVAIAAIPEALPAVIAVALAIGARRLVNQHALVKRLYAVETLGSVNYICTDKTGTLTQNKMQVVEVWLPGQDPDHTTFIKALHLNHNVTEKEDELIGDPTEVALALYARSHAVFNKAWKAEHPRLQEIPFDSDRKAMTTIHNHGAGHMIITKGAVESIMKICTEVPFSKELNIETERMAQKGLRVMAYACGFTENIPDKISVEAIESGLTFLGLAGLSDPPRPEVKQAIAECKNASIVPVMITGDHLITAKAIASELGIISNSDELSLTGEELNKLTDDAFQEKVEMVRVYARVCPAQKMQIVKALQSRGHFVAMTGDGVNDAPSLKIANIGIAMGITGSDVSKESAQMILLDDNFATIVNAVREGRRIYANIRKFIFYILAGNLSELFTICIAPMFSIPMPLFPVQILWINLVTDGLPALALSFEPAETDIMKTHPQKADKKILDKNFGINILISGGFIGVTTLVTAIVLINLEVEAWQTMVFTILCFSQFGPLLFIRSRTVPLFSGGKINNKWLVAALVLTVALQMLIIYVPYLHTFFRTDYLELWQMLVVILMSSLAFFFLKLLKLIVKRNVAL